MASVQNDDDDLEKATIDFESYTLPDDRPSIRFQERFSRLKEASLMVFPNWHQPILRAPQGFVMQVPSKSRFCMDVFATQMFLGTTISEIRETETEIFTLQNQLAKAIEEFHLNSHQEPLVDAPSIFGNENNMDSTSWSPFWSSEESYVGLYAAQIMNETTSSWTRKWFLISHNGLHPSVQKELEQYMLDCESKKKTYGQVFAHDEVMERARSIARRSRRRIIKSFADKLGLHVESRDDTHSIKDCISGYFEITSNGKDLNTDVLLKTESLACNPFDLDEKYLVCFTNLEQVSASRYRLEFQIKQEDFTSNDSIHTKKIEDFANRIKTMVNERLTTLELGAAHLEHICFMSQYSLAKAWIDCELNTFQQNAHFIHYYSDCVSLSQCKGNVIIQRTPQQGPLLLRMNDKRTSLCGQSWSNQANDAFIGRYKQKSSKSQQQVDVGFLNPGIFKNTSNRSIVQEPPLNLSPCLDQIERTLGKNSSFQSSIEFQPFLVKLNK